MQYIKMPKNDKKFLRAPQFIFISGSTLKKLFLFIYLFIFDSNMH